VRWVERALSSGKKDRAYGKKLEKKSNKVTTESDKDVKEKG